MNSSAEAKTPDRMEQLEREVARLSAALEASKKSFRSRWWASFIAAVFVIAGAVVAHETGSITISGLAPSVAKRLEAKEFGLYNRKDLRVLLGTLDKWGLPNLIFMDLEKQYRMGLKVWPEGGGTPGMVFYDKSGIRGNFRIEEDGSTVLNLLSQGKPGGQGGKGGIRMAVNADGDPSLEITDRDGKVVTRLPARSGAGSE